MTKPNKPLQILSTGIVLVIVLLIGVTPETQVVLATLVDNYILIPEEKSINLEDGLEKSIVNRVVDGDAIVLEDGRTIRYLYVDTPETVKPGTPVECYGAEASEFNKKIADRRTVILVKDKEDRDKYGRTLRLVFLEGANYQDPTKSINAQIVSRGFGITKTYSPNTTHKETFQKLEDQAKSKNQGLWSACNSTNSK